MIALNKGIYHEVSCCISAGSAVTSDTPLDLTNKATPPTQLVPASIHPALRDHNNSSDELSASNSESLPSNSRTRTKKMSKKPSVHKTKKPKSARNTRPFKIYKFGAFPDDLGIVDVASTTCPLPSLISGENREDSSKDEHFQTHDHKSSDTETMTISNKLYHVKSEPISSSCSMDGSVENVEPESNSDDQKEPQIVDVKTLISNPRMKRHPDMTPEELKDQFYWDKRRKNNEAAKKSRVTRRQKESGLTKRADLIEQENIEMRNEILALQAEIETLKFLVAQQDSEL